MDLQEKKSCVKRKTDAGIPFIQTSRGGGEGAQRVKGQPEKPRPQEREEGKGQEEGPQARLQAVQEVTMGVTAFGPPPNLMRGGSLKEAPSL